MFCLNCGAKVDDSAAYCPNCGQSTAAQPPTPAPQQQPQPPPLPYQPPPPAPQQPLPPPLPYQPPPPYQQQPWGYVPTRPSTEGLFIASLILGICSILFYPLGIILGALAIVFYAIGLKHLSIQPALRGKGMGIAGLVTGIIGAAASILFWAVVAFDWGSLNL